MPKDIRSFFGGGSASQQSPSQSQKQEASQPKGKSSKRRVVDDSDDDEDDSKKSLPSRPTPKKQAPVKDTSPKYTATTASAYFDKPKTKSSTPTKANTTSTGSKKSKKISKHDDLDDIDNDDDIFKSDFKHIKDDDYDEGSDLEMEEVQAKPVPTKTRGKTVNDDKAAAKKRKSDQMDDQDKTPKKAAPKKTKKEPAVDGEEVKKVLDDIPLVRPPTPPKRDQDGKYKVNWAKRAPDASAGTGAAVDLPEGAENCLAGLTFVFTGVLDTLDRDSGKKLVQQYGGKVTGAPSKKTSYVVLGSDAGPSKLNTIKQFGLKTINEEGLFKLITSLPAHGGDGAAAQAAKQLQQKKDDLAREQALEEEMAEKKALAKAKEAAKAASSTGRAPPAPVNNNNKLWTVKYAPTSLDQIVGNKTSVQKLSAWLRDFRKNAKLNFKLAGKDGTGSYRAVMIHGPPGIGKTTAAHLVAKLEGYDIVESNASDTRSKKLIEEGLKGVLGATSLNGYFAGDGKTADEHKKNVVLIMDEVDGMSAGDRGGVGAMAAVCKKTQIPIILICNERKLPKMRPFDHVTYDMPFRRPTTDMIRARLMTIAYREKLKIPPNALNAIIDGTGADIRQTVNMLSTVKLDETNLDFEKGKDMSKAWQKHVVLKPWDIMGKILGGAMFHGNSKSSLNEKIELYFNDHEFSHLMVQENYLKTNMALANNETGPERTLKVLELASKAADSFSDGDLVDRMIHGTQQHWSLMPTHAIFSFVRPASFVYGSLGYNSTGFTSWLGNNSKQGKLTRYIKEIQGHMRLRSTADRHEVRQQYVPIFWSKLPKRLMVDGSDAIEDAIDLMDNYYLTRDDFDAIIELGLGHMDEKNLKIDTKTKTAFTRKYNSMSHPLPFMKASEVIAPKNLSKEKPDLEEAIEESDEGEVVEEVKEEDQENDISKDKYIQAPKKKKAAPSKGKKRAVDSDAEDSEAKKPKTAKGKGKAKK